MPRFAVDISADAVLTKTVFVDCVSQSTIKDAIKNLAERELRMDLDIGVLSELNWQINDYRLDEEE